MQRFFFHLHDDLDAIDPEGAELADLAAARATAVTHITAIMCETLKRERRVVLHHRIDIEDGHGSVIDTVRFGDVVRVEE